MSIKDMPEREYQQMQEFANREEYPQAWEILDRWASKKEKDYIGKLFAQWLGLQPNFVTAKGAYYRADKVIEALEGRSKEPH